MGRQRKPAPDNIIQLNFLGMVDYVTLRTKPHYVEQHDGTWPPYAEVIASRVIPRQPRPLGRRGEHKPEFLSDRWAEHRHEKWCAHCAEWVNRLEFAENRSQRDGLQKWCRSCSNRHAKRMYWQAKEMRQQAA